MKVIHLLVWLNIISNALLLFSGVPRKIRLYRSVKDTPIRQRSTTVHTVDDDEELLEFIDRVMSVLDAEF